MRHKTHLRQAGRDAAQGVKNAVEATSEGRVQDAVKFAWEGMSTTTQQVGQGMLEGTSEFIKGALTANETHMQNAGRSVVKGVRDAVDKASEGDVLDATKSALQGATAAAQQVGKSIIEGTSDFIMGTRRDEL